MTGVSRLQELERERESLAYQLESAKTLYEAALQVLAARLTAMAGALDYIRADPRLPRRLREIAIEALAAADPAPTEEER